MDNSHNTSNYKSHTQFLPSYNYNIENFGNYNGPSGQKTFVAAPGFQERRQILAQVEKQIEDNAAILNQKKTNLKNLEQKVQLNQSSVLDLKNDIKSLKNLLDQLKVKESKLEREQDALQVEAQHAEAQHAATEKAAAQQQLLKFYYEKKKSLDIDYKNKLQQNQKSKDNIEQTYKVELKALQDDVKQKLREVQTNEVQFPLSKNGNMTPIPFEKTIKNPQLQMPDNLNESFSVMPLNIGNRPATYKVHKETSPQVISQQAAQKAKQARETELKFYNDKLAAGGELSNTELNQKAKIERQNYNESLRNSSQQVQGQLQKQQEARIDTLTQQIKADLERANREKIQNI
jgi:hypothetical protein